MRVPFWPRSLAARTGLVLLLGLAAVQGAGLVVYSLDRIGLERIAQLRGVTTRVMFLYRSLARATPERRDALLAPWRKGPLRASLSRTKPAPNMAFLPLQMRQILRAGLFAVPLPPRLHPQGAELRGSFARHVVFIGLELPDGTWLAVRAHLPPIRPWHSPDFLLSLLLMTALAGGLSWWAVRRLVAPVATLAEAAERLGRDVNADPLSETGPTEVALAAAAFNTMASRIRRFVEDRTFMLTAIGHDLRTPITRLKLRAEFMEDDEQRRKMLADLDELEAMVAATLAFGRDVTTSEPLVPIDLAALLRTIVDEASDARPELAEKILYEGPQRLALRARPIALKRALANLVANAIKYGGGARVGLAPAERQTVRITIEDEGPGIPPADLDRVFQPFQRGEASRNRETGGTGLGLPIARNILRAHGGDVALANRPTGGVRALVSLPL